MYKKHSTITSYGHCRGTAVASEEHLSEWIGVWSTKHTSPWYYVVKRQNGKLPATPEVMRLVRVFHCCSVGEMMKYKL